MQLILMRCGKVFNLRKGVVGDFLCLGIVIPEHRCPIIDCDWKIGRCKPVAIDLSSIVIGNTNNENGDDGNFRTFYNDVSDAWFCRQK